MVVVLPRPADIDNGVVYQLCRGWSARRFGPAQHTTLVNKNGRRRRPFLFNFSVQLFSRLTLWSGYSHPGTRATAIWIVIAG